MELHESIHSLSFREWRLMRSWLKEMAYFGDRLKRLKVFGRDVSD